MSLWYIELQIIEIIFAKVISKIWRNQSGLVPTIGCFQDLGRFETRLELMVCPVCLVIVFVNDHKSNMVLVDFEKRVQCHAMSLYLFLSQQISFLKEI
jgi:hypothetical protein